MFAATFGLRPDYQPKQPFSVTAIKNIFIAHELNNLASGSPLNKIRLRHAACYFPGMRVDRFHRRTHHLQQPRSREEGRLHVTNDGR